MVRVVRILVSGLPLVVEILKGAIAPTSGQRGREALDVVV